MIFCRPLKLKSRSFSSSAEAARKTVRGPHRAIPNGTLIDLTLDSESEDEGSEVSFGDGVVLESLMEQDSNIEGDVHDVSREVAAENSEGREGLQTGIHKIVSPARSRRSSSLGAIPVVENRNSVDDEGDINMEHQKTFHPSSPSPINSRHEEVHKSPPEAGPPVHTPMSLDDAISPPAFRLPRDTSPNIGDRSKISGVCYQPDRWVSHSSRVIPGTVADLLPELDKYYDEVKTAT